MKKFAIYFLLLSSITFLFSCIKNEDVVFTGSVAELDGATWNANAVNVTYPILTRVPADGRALTSSCPDSTLRRFSRTIRLRVNLVGPQSAKEETVGYKTFSSPIDSTAFPATLFFGASNACKQIPEINSAPLPSSPGAPPTPRLFVSNAVAGTHYNITSPAGKVIIPANSSFGYIDIQILNQGSSAQGRFLGIQLDETGSLKPNFNYSQVGLVIDQR